MALAGDWQDRQALAAAPCGGMEGASAETIVCLSTSGLTQRCKSLAFLAGTLLIHRWLSARVLGLLVHHGRLTHAEWG